MDFYAFRFLILFDQTITDVVWLCVLLEVKIEVESEKFVANSKRSFL